MKFDIARAWKDEAYRQTLSAEQLETLPINPVGELTDAEMATVCGSGDGNEGGWNGLGAAGVASAASSSSRHTHSFSVLCDINIFSLSAHVLWIGDLLDIANQEKQICINQE